MKKLNKIYAQFLFFFMMTAYCTKLQAQDSTKKDIICTVGFYVVNNTGIYLTVHAKTKIDGRFKPVPKMPFKVYLDKDSAAYLTGRVVTDSKGEASSLLSPILKDKWNELPLHTFIATTEGDKDFNPAKAETPVKKVRLMIDTAAGRNITASLVEWKDGQWLPVKGVDIKVAVKRLQSNLPVSDKELYTTDSTGTITVEYKRDSLPGDSKGMLTLVALVEDNDVYGNLRTEKKVSWGTVLKQDNSFDKRTLFATRFKTPVWLLFMAYSIVICVWSVIFYLLFQIKKMKRRVQVV